MTNCSPTRYHAVFYGEIQQPKEESLSPLRLVNRQGAVYLPIFSFDACMPRAYELKEEN